MTKKALILIFALAWGLPACLTETPPPSTPPKPRVAPRPAVRLVVVPQLVGARLTHARARLRFLGLPARVTLVKYDRRRQLGRVFRQKPGPGARVPAGSPVRIWAFAATGTRLSGPIPKPPSASPRPPAPARPPRPVLGGLKSPPGKYRRLVTQVEALKGDIDKVAELPSVRGRYQASLEIKKRLFRLRWRTIERSRQDRGSPVLKAVLRRLLGLEMLLDRVVRGKRPVKK
jgi:hypothetical protein